jgi:GGDEF domain-containing protein
LLRPDPVTGLPRLPSLLGRLGEALGGLRNGVGSVAVLLIEVVQPGPAGHLPDGVLTAVGNRLKEHVRGDDMVGRVGRSTFAVVATLRTGPVDAPLIEKRLMGALTSAEPALPGGLSIRSAMATATPDGTTGPEELLRHVAAQLALS